MPLANWSSISRNTSFALAFVVPSGMVIVNFYQSERTAQLLKGEFISLIAVLLRHYAPQKEKTRH